MQRPNIYAVAERAGVSIATVSRVQNAKDRVAPETRDRVLRAIEELRYWPNATGRALAQQRQDASGIVFRDLSGPYFSELITGCEQRVAAAGQSLLILATHGSERAAELIFDLVGRVDGLIVLGFTVDDDVVRDLDRLGIPLVLLARKPVDDVPAVRSENVEAAVRVTNHLFGCGHDVITFLGDPDGGSDFAERWQGFVEAHRRAGRPAPEAPVAVGSDEPEGRAAAARLLGAPGRAGAFMCASDQIALGVLAAAQEAGVRVPDDLAVTGWDDIEVARYVAPALTTVRQPTRLLGARAAELLFERIERGSTPSSEVLSTELVVRASCGSRQSRQSSTPGGVT